ncbi:hypothetical protein A7982_12146 [Minicystis rosea]|nr:hypothetical protein A7982_12146 [Minicystis rosea]
MQPFRSANAIASHPTSLVAMGVVYRIPGGAHAPAAPTFGPVLRASNRAALR